VVKEHI